MSCNKTSNIRSISRTAVATALICACAATACLAPSSIAQASEQPALSATTGSASANENVKSPRLNKKSLTIKRYGQAQLRVSNAPKMKHAKITWKTSKPKIASVSTRGKVKAKRPGKTTITARIAGKILHCQITVKKTADVDGYVKSLSLRDEVGSLFMVAPESLAGNASATRVTRTMKRSIKRYRIGGVCLFATNIRNPKQLKKLTNDLQKTSSHGMFVATDEEGGRVLRVASNPKFHLKRTPSMRNIGKTKGTSRAYRTGKYIGSYLRTYGINLDFAPVADINTNPRNQVIGDRAFGSKPGMVGKEVAAEIRGFHKSGVMTCVKHFPGHGNTTGDTHLGYVSTGKTWSQMRKCEIIPFKKAIASHTDFIMAAHITAPKVTHNHLPASLSKTMLTKKLRKELGYKGIIITDSMSMGAISQRYSSSKAAVKAINAGADIILMPQSLPKAYNGVLKAVKSGKIKKSRLDASAKRLARAKQKYGIRL